MPQAALERADEFDLPEALTIAPGGSGLPCLHIDTPDCQGRQYLLGATVTHWQPSGYQPVLFTSQKAEFADGTAIRGGVPICFPWFGPHPNDDTAPAHGLVRTEPWQLLQTARGPAGVETQMVTRVNQLHADYRVTFGNQLTLCLTITNNTDTDQTFEAALHTYFVVGDASQVTITGLEQADYLDKMRDAQTFNQGKDPVVFTGETDRVYQNTQSTCTLTDPVLGRRITVEKLGSNSTVVWNPWIDKSKRMADFGDDEWTGMCCIESANLGPHAVTLAPAESHTLRVTIGVVKI